MVPGHTHCLFGRSRFGWHACCPETGFAVLGYAGYEAARRPLRCSYSPSAPLFSRHVEQEVLSEGEEHDF